MASGNANIPGADADSLESSISRSEWVHGWKMVVVALAAYVLGATGMFFAFGLFFKPFSSEFHWSREAISGFRSISSLTYAVASPFVGRLADRFGMKRVILISAVLCAIGFGAQGLLTGQLWQFYILAFLIAPPLQAHRPLPSARLNCPGAARNSPRKPVRKN